MRTSFILTCTAAAAVLSVAFPVRADIILDGGGLNSLDARVRDGRFGSAFVDSNDVPSGIPDTINRLTVHQFSRNTNDTVLNNNGFSFDFLQQVARSGVSFTSFARNMASIRFAPTVDTDYELSGSFTGDGPLFMSMNVTLTEVGAGSFFSTLQTTNTSSGDTFILGQGGGNNTNTESGNLTGTLAAGTTYELFLNTNITSNSNDRAFSNGVINLDFTPSPIPAPGAALLALIGVPFVGWARRRLR
jgi:hypothetical protein